MPTYVEFQSEEGCIYAKFSTYSPFTSFHTLIKLGVRRKTVEVQTYGNTYKNPPSQAKQNCIQVMTVSASSSNYVSFCSIFYWNLFYPFINMLFKSLPYLMDIFR